MEIVWEERGIIRKQNGDYKDPSNFRYVVNLPDFLNSWDVYDEWERVRFSSMEENLKQGDILVDVGVEAGWQNIIYASFVGPKNMILVEPSSDYWPNIKTIWERNFGYDDTPLACFMALAADKSSNLAELTSYPWPKASLSGEMTSNRGAYRSLLHHSENIPVIALDDVCLHDNINAITIDVEGSELKVLKGSSKILKHRRPLVWVSIHQDLMANQGDTKQELLEFMKEIGYSYESLGYDHEEHAIFSPR